MSDCVLITGATGNLGTALVSRLLADRGVRVMGLVRARDQEHLAERRRKLLGILGEGIDSERLVLIRGDITAPGLGLSRRDRELVEAEVKSILHAAASVRFDLPSKVAARQNIQGSEAILNLAQRLHARGCLRRLDYVSTCYIAGDRLGRVYEHECDEGQKFRNSYEWSKCQAELRVRAAIETGLPAAIYRPSIIAGDSKSGATRSFHALYWPLMVYSRGWWRTLPGNPDAIVDVVPLDFVLEAITRLRSEERSLGQCFHLASGDKAVRLHELAVRLQEWVGGPPVRYVDQRIWRFVVRPLLSPVLMLTRHGRAVFRGADVFMPYFESNPVFDTTNARNFLSDYHPPPVLSYFDSLMRYAEEHEFGRKL